MRIESGGVRQLPRTRGAGVESRFLETRRPSDSAAQVLVILQSLEVKLVGASHSDILRNIHREMLTFRHGRRHCQARFASRIAPGRQ